MAPLTVPLALLYLKRSPQSPLSDCLQRKLKDKTNLFNPTPPRPKKTAFLPVEVGSVAENMPTAAATAAEGKTLTAVKVPRL